jgi:hypothetical protein
LVVVAGLGTWSFIDGLRNELEARRNAFWMRYLVGFHESALLHQNVTNVVARLRDVDRCYRRPQPPTLAVQRHLHNIMECVRASAERDIIDHLRTLTGEDLGNDPKPWIKNYAEPEQ